MNNIKLALIIFVTILIVLICLINSLQAKILYHPVVTVTPGNWKSIAKGKTKYHGSIYASSRSSDSASSSKKEKFMFLHGNMGNTEIQKPDILLNKLPGNYYVFEYPGYGFKSTDNTNKINVINQASDALKSVATIDSPVYLIGQSLGTGVAAELANKYSHLVKGVILITPYTKMEELFNNYIPLSGIVTRGHKYNTIDNLKQFIKQNPDSKNVILGAFHDEIIPFAYSEKIAKYTDVPLITVVSSHNGTLEKMKDDQWGKLKNILND